MLQTHVRIVNLLSATGLMVKLTILLHIQGIGFAEASTYINPVIDSNIPDPGVLALQDGSGYVVVSTSNYAEIAVDPLFPIHFSTNLIDWTLVNYVFPDKNYPKWVKDQMWAPEIHYVNGTYYVYFSGHNNDPDCHAIIPGSCHSIGVAISETGGPFGPYQDYGTPILDGRFGVIDITWYQDAITGKSYLSWKENPAAHASSIHIRQVEADGISFREEWPDVKLIQSDLIHDELVTEGPWIIYREPYYYLFFSTHLFTGPHYQTEVARSTDVLGPYERLSTPICHTDFDRFLNGINCTFVAPGHGSTVQTLDGNHWYLYHGWRYKESNQNPPGRVLLLDLIRWDVLPDGPWPFIGVPSDVPTPSPDV